ncbi:MAG: aminotransferase class I/II-fold pyridoxal phosphate-dependent enzyme [Calditrichaeota bacterium]|nr:MAG: aminotransferase class I/II-fold pyridoxal phosphate-dependent enzyme [Calditrichota bacterium]MBL1205237.1 aminotransferase class I/II-fold pyridoxal phosphate-dependent enzyme [Calditrichota bacterium]NOG45066.1 aminotransferase class I/II-fold pyridoxal phosphate-dependent enzyme [Calditrichota bacterium]
MDNSNSLGPLKLHSIKTAKVSEISETTAAANIPDGEKINFHIGNPLQDEHLVDLYFSLCTGFPKSVLDGELPETKTPDEINKLSFIYESIKNAVPYLPRGGYSSSNPPAIIKKMQHWLQNQEEPLLYSFGEKSSRECILSTGGKYEFLRILFSVLDRYSASLPFGLITYDFELPDHLKKIDSIKPLLDLTKKINKITVEKILESNSGNPFLVLIGKQPDENERRVLRKSLEDKAALFVELFDAPNHKSLSRESGLKNSVLRFISPTVFGAQFSDNATQFVLGNAAILKRIEAVHFELKGTPSSTERDLTEYLIKLGNKPEEDQKAPSLRPLEDNIFEKRFSNDKAVHYNKFENRIASFSNRLEKYSSTLLKKSQKPLARYKKRYESNLSNDEYEFQSAVELFTRLNSNNLPGLEDAFLGQFVKHNPQYDIQNCCAISGSSRTALSILGHHCSIKEIITFDWSWSYENGFQKVITVPLFINGKLNTSGLIKKVGQKLKQDPHWKNCGAVIINNPHNASGEILDEHDLSKLLIELLDQNICVIDDLCYKDVAPSKKEIKVKTLKEIALEVAQKGHLSSKKIDNLITTHALSKTDCFAGARLTVVEISVPHLNETFLKIGNYIQPNKMALFLAYLFYRNNHQSLKQFWALRNSIFADRANGIKQAFTEFPADRNPFQVSVKLPSGSMYPHLVIKKFPKGVSTDNIGLKLAKRGIGLIPLTTFSKTADGFAEARNSFRMSLGGKDDAETLKNKSRHLVIEMNRLLNDESRDYQLLKHAAFKQENVSPVFEEATVNWDSLINEIKITALAGFKKIAENLDSADQEKEFYNTFLPWRLSILNRRFSDLKSLYSRLLNKIKVQDDEILARQIKAELYKDDLENRENQFKKRLFDRTVHPTQMYSLKVDLLINDVLESLFFDQGKITVIAKTIADEIISEFFGVNIPINSEQEAYELIFDLKTMINNELYSESKNTMLSFWGDWDGSTRPSGQGHRLVASVVLENVKQMARLLETLQKHDPAISINSDLAAKLKKLQKGINTFWELLNKITRLTNQLEKKYKGLLPTDVKGGRFRNIAVKMKLRRDPLSVLFSHNSRLEKKMLHLRQQRKNSLEFYFELNKTLRKELHLLVPQIIQHKTDPKIALLAASYRNLLTRFVLTPRIHQKTITSKDPFTIENTVHNLLEINEIGDRFGNPAIIMALQISMSSRAKALIELNRLIAGKAELINRENPDRTIKGFWLIPLFEEESILNNLQEYLDDIWSYAEQSRFIKQPVSDRFQEILCEIFVAGSDLSQQIGQAKSWDLFKGTKFLFYKWLAQKGIIGKMRIKLGCGEPMQRQGGYFNDFSGKAVLFKNNNSKKISNHLLKPAAQKSLQFATSPLKGLHSGGELRTVQSNAAEHIFRFTNFEDRSQLFYHISMQQKLTENDLIRVGKLFQKTRLNLKEKGINELQRINRISNNKVLSEFLKINKESFRQILYGKDEDVVGIHAITYFISQMVPTLRDRPTVRPSRETSQLAGQKIVERIAQTLPLSHHGSLLRAIGHNRAQSMIIGVNQLSTGLFRSLKLISDQYGISGVKSILSDLPVMEILNGLRMYQQDGDKYIKQLAPAFKTGNSALHAIDEDFEYIREFIPLFQKELVARQGLVASDFFEKNVFKTDLLPLLRPDIAVLLQDNLFNTKIDTLVSSISTDIPKEWLTEMIQLLELPQQIQEWRSKIWELIGKNIFHQVSSFVDLAGALTTLASNISKTELPANLGQSRSNRLINQVNTLLRGAADDSMRQFLYSVVEYVSRLPQNSVQLPIDTMRVLHDIERIIKIDEQLLSQKEQSKLRFYILQMARLAGENG